MTATTCTRQGRTQYPVVVDDDGFRVEGVSGLSEEHQRRIDSMTKYSYYAPERLRDGARVGWFEESGIAFVDPDEWVQMEYNELDGVVYEVLSPETLAFAGADETDKSDMDLLEEAVGTFTIEGEMTFRMWVEVETIAKEYLGERMVRCDFLTVKAESKDAAWKEFCTRITGLNISDITVARKFPTWDIESETIRDPTMDETYSWVHTPADSTEQFLIGPERGDY